MPGVILGTAAYMSPEQARGKPVDRRTDIWAFGAVLYEMLTGRRAFDGEDVTDVLGAVMRAEPDWQALPPEVPPAIRALIHGCLKKDWAQRVADISTARFVIDAASSLADARPATPSPARRWSAGLGRRLPRWPRCSAGAWLWTIVRPVPAAVAHYTVTPDEGQEMAESAGVDIALSPDGAWMVYVGSTPGGGTRLLRRNLHELDAVAMPGSEGASAPVVSPDGRSVAFLANGAIRTLPIGGGPPFTVVTAGGAPAWSDDGLIYYGRGNVTYRVPAHGRRAGCGHDTGAEHPPATSRRAARRTRTAAHALSRHSRAGPSCGGRSRRRPPAGDSHRHHGALCRYRPHRLRDRERHAPCRALRRAASGGDRTGRADRRRGGR